MATILSSKKGPGIAEFTMQANTSAPMGSVLEAVAENLKLSARQADLDQQELAALGGLNRTIR